MENIVSQKQETREPISRIEGYRTIELKSREGNQHKDKFFKGMCNKCGKYCHRASFFWVNENKVHLKNVQRVLPAPDGTIYLVDINGTRYLGSI